MAPNPNIPAQPTNEVTVSPPYDNNATVPHPESNAAHVTRSADIGKILQSNAAAFKKAFRRWKLSSKKGAGLIVTRYTRKGRPVY